MLTVNQNYKNKNDALAKWPVYVAELFFNNGNSGADGTNDIYFATCDVNEIVGFPNLDRWFPFLMANSIGSMSQTVDPINGVSSVGSLNISLTDFQGMVSAIIKAADSAGHGLRRQRISIHKLFRGMDWADRVTIRTMQVNDLRLTRLNEYKLTAADVQRQMQKTIFNPHQTTLTADIASTGAVTIAVTDTRNFLSSTQQDYGTVGFFKVNEEIMMWSSKTDIAFTVSLSGRGMFGTVAATHASGETIDEIIVLRENPITMALKIMESSGSASSNGTWDAYPTRWGCDMDSMNDIDEVGILKIGKLLTGLSDTPLASDGVQFEFVIDAGIEAKQFIEDRIWKILGCFGFVGGDGKYSIKAYSDLANAAKENAVATLDENNVVSWGDLSYNYNDLANQVWIEYDEQPKISGKFIRNTLFIDSVSIKKHGPAKQLKYQAQGVIPTSVFASQLYQRFQRVLARYSRPPMQIPLTLLPKMDKLEIGDIVRVRLPILDLFTGAPLDRAFEIISDQLKPNTGEVSITCIAQPERASFWFQGVGSVESVTISPAVISIVTGNTFQLVARAFDATGSQIAIPAISWIATGNVSVSSSGLVTAGAVGGGTVQAVVGDKVSNTCALTITSSTNTNPVASVVIAPSAITFEAGQIQTMTAISYDVNGDVVEGKIYTWASSVTGVATIPAGPSASATLTAVANGNSNITATETGSAIASSPCIATVATPQTPTYTPPTINDSAYQVGTHLTAATHPTIIAGGSAPYTFVNGANLPSGDYWFDGDISLSAGDTITINGTVRLFCMGTVTINGAVDGSLRGGAANTTGSGGIGNVGIQGFVGAAGDGGNLTRSGVYLKAGNGLPPLFQSVPVLTPQPTSITSGSWDGVTGLPTVLHGGSSGSGVIYDPNAIPLTYTSQYGGGAGLLIMARGIYLSAGSVDLRGYPFVSDGQGDRRRAYPGGAGGGSFVALAERDANGLPVMSIAQNKIFTSGGYAITSLEPSSLNSSVVLPQNGKPGAIINQVIG